MRKLIHVFLNGVIKEVYLNYDLQFKNLFFFLNPDFELQVNSPLNVSEDCLRRFINLHLERMVTYQKQKLANDLLQFKKAMVGYFGQVLELKPIITKATTKYEVLGNKLFLHLKPSEFGDDAVWLRLIKKFYFTEATNYIIKRTQKLASRHNFIVGKIRIKWLEKKWGSCSFLKNDLTFAAQLIAFNKQTIDYVIFHELCHTLVPNHSAAFWCQLAVYYPNYQEAKLILKYELAG